MNAYWTFQIIPNSPRGFWSWEIKIDGQPSGSIAFELVMPPPAPVTPNPGHLERRRKRFSSVRGSEYHRHAIRRSAHLRLGAETDPVQTAFEFDG